MYKLKAAYGYLAENQSQQWLALLRHVGFGSLALAVNCEMKL